MGSDAQPGGRAEEAAGSSCRLVVDARRREVLLVVEGLLASALTVRMRDLALDVDRDHPGCALRLDLSGVTLIDAGAVAAVLAIHRRRAAAGETTAVVVSDAVARAVNRLGKGRALPMELAASPLDERAPGGHLRA